MLYDFNHISKTEGITWGENGEAHSAITLLIITTLNSAKTHAVECGPAEVSMLFCEPIPFGSCKTGGEFTPDAETCVSTLTFRNL